MLGSRLYLRFAITGSRVQFLTWSLLPHGEVQGSRVGRPEGKHTVAILKGLGSAGKDNLRAITVSIL